MVAYIVSYGDVIESRGVGGLSRVEERVEESHGRQAGGQTAVVPQGYHSSYLGKWMDGDAQIHRDKD